MADPIQPQPQKWALLIGINEYPEWGSGYQLKGPIHDIDAIETVLTGPPFGFPPENVCTLTSPADGKRKRALANRENILGAFHTHLIENKQIREGDVVVFFYSGHGSWLRDQDQDEEVDVVDGLRLARDETLVPCDSGADHARDIRDDEIADLLDRLAQRTHNINLFFDCCHSGTITRVMPEEEGAEDRMRWLPPPPGSCAVPGPATPLTTRAVLPSKGPSGWLAPNDNYVVLSACHASERARERRFPLKGLKHHGIMTYCLLQALRDVGAETTYYDVWAALKTEVKRLCREQTPQIEGAFERKVFGGATLPRQRYVEVTGKSADAVTLAAGLVHGATAGSRFAIYRPGTQVFEDEAARVAMVELTEMGPFTSTGVLRQGDVAAVQVGAPAVEIEHDYGTMQMVVRVVGDDPILDAVRQQIGESPLLILATTLEQPSTASVLLRYPRKSDANEDTSRGKVLTIVSSSDGRALVKPLAPDAAGPRVVRERLDDVARCHNLLAIRNADPQSRLKGKIRLRLQKCVGHEVLELVQGDEGGNVTLRDGDKVYLEVENQSDQLLHVCIFNFLQPEWQPSILFPERGARDDSVPAHGSRRIGRRFRVQWPAGYPRPEVESLPLPQDTTKLFATTRQVDFHSFWLSRTRALEEKTSLPRLIGLAGGGGPEPVTRSWGEEEEDWTTAEMFFQIIP